MFKLHHLPETVHIWHPSTLIVTGFGSGLIRPASGTIGSLFFAGLILPFWMHQSIWVHFGVFCALFAFGTAFIKVVLKRQGDAKLDPSWIVIDEWAGLSAALLTAYSPLSFLLGLALFRFFDIVKIGPVKWLDTKISGAFGVMLDDVAAGVISCLILMVFQLSGLLR